MHILLTAQNRNKNPKERKHVNSENSYNIILNLIYIIYKAEIIYDNRRFLTSLSSPSSKSRFKFVSLTSL